MATLKDLMKELLRTRDNLSDEVVTRGGLRLRFVRTGDPAPALTEPYPAYIAAYRLAPQAPSPTEINTLINTINSILNENSVSEMTSDLPWKSKRSSLETKTITVAGQRRTAKGYYLTWQLVAEEPQAELV